MQIVPKSRENYGNCVEIEWNERILVENGAEIVENEPKWALAGAKSDVGMILGWFLLILGFKSGPEIERNFKTTRARRIHENWCLV